MRTAAALLGLGTSSVERAKQQETSLRQEQPTEPVKDLLQVQDLANGPADNVLQDSALDALMDICLANAAEGRSFLAFERDAERNRRRGVDLGKWPCNRLPDCHKSTWVLCAFLTFVKSECH
jgi:hypothetical protein